MDIQDILKEDRGARFYRGDLHIHSVVGSHDVTDKTATPDAIVRLAKSEGLDLIAIADHNEIGGVADALRVGAELDIFVVPAVELSTPHGHLLCYFPTLEALTRFYSSLSIADRGKPDSRCSNGTTDCLDKVRAEGGFAILAHVDGGKGLETVLPGNPPHKKDIVCHRALLGIELTSIASPVSYSGADSDPQRRQLGKDRITLCELGQSQYLARILNSDAHTLASLGRNASHQKKVTRYKMQALSFAALRMALEDADARVRIEEEVPTAVPLVRAVRMDGGFLHEQYIHFGPNLNCIIGGRGTGKSTTFEAIRILTGQPGGTDVIDSDVWPDNVELAVQDQAGQLHLLARAKGGIIENAADPFDGPISFGVECYGQGETQSISQKAQNDPAALLEYLDRFVDIDADLATEQELLDEILDLQSKIEEAVRNVERIPQIERDLAFKKSQLDELQKANAKEVIELTRKLEAEKRVRVGIQEDLKALGESATHEALRETVGSIVSAAEPDTLEVGRAEFDLIVTSANVFKNHIDSSEAAMRAAVKSLTSAANGQLSEWRDKAQTTVSEIETKKKELLAKNIHLDMTYINRLTADEASLTETLRKLKTWVPHLKELRQQRSRKLKERWAARSRISAQRAAFAQKSSATLNSVLGDLQVSLKFVESGHSPEAKDIIVEAMNWRTSQVPRATMLVDQLTLPKLLDAIAKKAPAAIQSLRSPEGTSAFSKADAEAIIERLAEPAHLFRLERAKVVDRPSLTVTRPVSGQSKPIVRDFSRLSLGQQQSVLLALMLSVDTDRPLLIDQPEDNLDSEFIYHTLVPVLRRAKERRQVIVVTHNANIAVLGDAEQIIVLKSNADKGVVVSRGSIDHPDTRNHACAILEGSNEAFRRRARIYGL
ncbi:MAG: AAA family ATPase [Hyphomonadaceae bacterium]|nr:AAA family ATPase [Hyphomonadaceae bacterium]